MPEICASRSPSAGFGRPSCVRLEWPLPFRAPFGKTSLRVPRRMIYQSRRIHSGGHFMTRLLVRTTAAALFAATAFAAAPALADVDKYLLSYEATPSAGYDLPKLKEAGYNQRAAFSQKAL